MLLGLRRGDGQRGFEDTYQTRCTFTEADNETAKCEVAVPDRNRPPS